MKRKHTTPGWEPQPVRGEDLPTAPGRHARSNKRPARVVPAVEWYLKREVEYFPQQNPAFHLPAHSVPEIEVTSLPINRGRQHKSSLHMYYDVRGAPCTQWVVTCNTQGSIWSLR